MQISNYNSNVNFQAIRLKPKDYEKSKQIMSRLANPALKREGDINELYNIFYPYIQKEAEYKSKPNTFNDVFSEMNLLFLELVNDIKNNPLLKDIIEKLNKYHPSKDVRNIGDNYNSLDLQMFSSNKQLRRIDRVTSDELPEYDSSDVAQKYKNTIKNLLETIQIPDKLKKILEQYASGMNLRIISSSENMSIGTIYRSIIQTIRKIQYKSGNLPKEIQNSMEAIKNAFNCDNDTAFNLILIHPQIQYVTTEKISSKLQSFSKILGIQEEKAKTCLFTWPEIINYPDTNLPENITQASKLLGLSREKFIEIGIKYPFLFYINPQKILQRIQKCAEVVNLTPQEYIERATKNYTLFATSPKILSQRQKALEYCRKVKGISGKALGTHTPQEYYRALINYLIRVNYPQSVSNNKVFKIKNFIKENSNGHFVFNIPEDEVAQDFVRYVTQESEQTIGKNIFEFNINKNWISPHTAHNFISEKKLMQVNNTVEELLKLPAYAKKDEGYLRTYVLEMLHLFNYSHKEIFKLLQKRPHVFSQRPKTLYKNYKIYNYYRRIQGKKPIDKPKPILNYSISSDIIFILLKQQYNNLVPLRRVNFNLEEFLKANKDKHFILEMPQDEVVQDVMRLITQISEKTIGKNIFEFKLVENIAIENIKSVKKSPVVIPKEELPQINSIVETISKLPNFSDKNPDHLRIRIFKILHLFNYSPEEIINIAKTQPIALLKKPEGLYKNYKIYNYYRRIQGKEPTDKIETSNSNITCSNIIFILLKQQYNNLVPLRRVNFNLEEFLKANKDKHFILEMPQDEVVQDVIQLITQISEKTIGKNIFEFKIIENSAKDIKPLDKPAVETVNEKLPNVVKDTPVPKDTPPLQNQTVKLSEEEKIKQINDVVANLIKLPKFSNEDVNYLRDYVQKMLNLYILSPKNVIEIITYQPGILNFKPENLYKLQFSYKFLPPNINRIAIQQ